MIGLDKNSSYREVWQVARRLYKLYVVQARLILAEKLSQLFSGVALGMIIFVLGICALVFLSLSLSTVLSDAIPEVWSHLIIAGIYIILIVGVVLFRKPLLANVVTRFISRIVLDDPNE